MLFCLCFFAFHLCLPPHTPRHTLTCDFSLCKHSANTTKGQSSKMAIRKKNAPATGTRCENASIKQRSKHVSVSNKQESPKGQGSLHTGCSTRNGSSRASHGHKTYSNDPSQVRQWAAGATGFASFEEATMQQPLNITMSNDALMTRTESQIPGSFPMSRSPVSHFSAPQSAHMFDTGLRTAYSELCAPNTANAVHGMPTVLNVQQGACLNGSGNITGAPYHEDVWSYPTPVAEDMFFAERAPMLSGNVDAWPPLHCLPGQEIATTAFPCTSNPMSWSPVSAVDASVSSSYSQSSIVGPQPDTPLSQTFQEGTWSSDQQGNLDPDQAAFPGFNIGESLQLPSPVEFVEQNTDGLRLVKLS